MAVTFTAADQIDRITCNATALNVTKLTLHERSRSLTIRGYAADGTTPTDCYLALSGTDGGAIGSDYLTIEAGEALEYAFAGRARVLGGKVVYLASAVNSGIVEVLAAEREG